MRYLKVFRKRLAPWTIGLNPRTTTLDVVKDVVLDKYNLPNGYIVTVFDRDGNRKIKAEEFHMKQSLTEVRVKVNPPTRLRRPEEQVINGKIYIDAFEKTCYDLAYKLEEIRVYQNFFGFDTNQEYLEFAPRYYNYFVAITELDTLRYLYTRIKLGKLDMSKVMEEYKVKRRSACIQLHYQTTICTKIPTR
jgi:hypothetical protein